MSGFIGVICQVKWDVAGIVTNIITCASGVPRDIRGIYFQAFLAGVIC